MGDGLLVQAFEAMGWTIPVVKRVAAGLLLASMVLFPVTFRHALLAYANKKAQVMVHGCSLCCTRRPRGHLRRSPPLGIRETGLRLTCA